MKFKNVEKKVLARRKKIKSPNNYRINPELFKFSFPKIDSEQMLHLYGVVLKVFVVSLFVVAIIVVGVDIKDNLRAKKDAEDQRVRLEEDLSFWEDFIVKHDDYRDAYFQASTLEYQLGNTSKAQAYVEKGLSLDPNSEEGRKIEELLK